MHQFSFIPTEEHRLVMQTARDFAHKYLLPDVIERDEEQRFAHEAIKKMAEIGFLGMIVSSQYGGGGMSITSYVLALMELSKIDPSTAITMAINNSLVCWGIETYGTDEQKKKYLSRLATGEVIGAFCLSEPESGSDATSLKVTADLRGDHYLINGTKNWITNAHTASIYLLFAQSDPSQGYRGINAFIVEKKSTGITVGKKENKMGLRSSDTRSIMFSDVQVPICNRLGEAGEGFRIAMSILNGGRIGIAAQATGIASGAYELALAYAQVRKTFKKPISANQFIQFKLAHMATQIEAARLLTLKAAAIKDTHKQDRLSSSVAKLYASQIAQEVTSEAVQIHGGYGYVKEYHVERMMRDAKITQIYEGTSEMQHITISKEILN